MMQKKPLISFIAILFLTSLACNAFAGEVEPALELPVSSATPVGTTQQDDGGFAAVAPTATLAGEEIGSGTPALENNAPTLTILVDLNIRTGPGVVYDRVGFFLSGSRVDIIGRDPVSGWWKIPCPGDVNAPECWVSGGAQYTLASNTGGVPFVAAPPTPTPQPTATPTSTPLPTAVGGNITAASQHLVVFTRENGLWMATVNTGPPTVALPMQLSTAVDITAVDISPNGEWIAYLRGDSRQNSLHVVNTAGIAEQFLVSSADVPMGTDAPLLVFIDQFAWLPDSSGLLFNSVVVNPEGPGRGPQNDLRQVLLDGTISEYFANGTAGETFALSPDGTQLLFSSPESILRGALGDDNLETVIAFDFVNTASEYAYTPVVQWAADSSEAYVSISSSEPWSEPPFATLYRIPRDGAAESLGEIAGIILFNPVLWTPDGERLAHVNFLLGENRAELQIGEVNGANLVTVATDSALTAYGWDSRGEKLLFSGGDFYGVAHLAADPLYIFPEGDTAIMKWLDGETFLTATSSPQGWRIVANTLDGAQTELFSSDAVFVKIDSWSP